MQYKSITGVVVVLVMIVTFGMVSPALADSYFKQVVHSDAYEIMGQKQPEKNDTTVLWLTEGKACAQTGDEFSVIFKAKENVIYFLDLKKKEYSEIHLNSATGGNEGDSETDKQAEMMKQAQAMMGSSKVTVTPTDKTKKIGDWQATMYNIEMSMAMVTTNQELWVTKDIDIDYSLFHTVYGGMATLMPGFGDLVEEMKQIEGVPVQTTTRASIMGKEMITTNTLIEHAEKDSPKGTYDIKDEFKKVEMNMGMGGH